MIAAIGWFIYINDHSISSWPSCLYKFVWSWYQSWLSLFIQVTTVAVFVQVGYTSDRCSSLGSFCSYKCPWQQCVLTLFIQVTVIAVFTQFLYTTDRDNNLRALCLYKWPLQQPLFSLLMQVSILEAFAPFEKCESVIYIVFKVLRVEIRSIIIR
jgi:hypothetical protein